MVSGGTYGTEDIVHGAGYGRAILILLLTPLLWSLPTAFMIGELSSALPFEGGYYAWVRRAMGNFWGFQEAWLSLVASIFDMAIYPTLFVAYLTRMFPWFQEGQSRLVGGAGGGGRLRAAEYCRSESRLADFALAVLRAVGAVHRDRGAGAVQARSAGQRRHQADDVERRHSRRPAHLHVELHGMGQCLDHRDRSRAPAADLPARHAGRGLRSWRISYVLPFAAMWMTGLKATAWETGSWADIAGLRRRPAAAHRRRARRHDQRLRHVQCAGDELLAACRWPWRRTACCPAVFGKLQKKSRAPWVAIIALAIGWAMCLGLGFARLVTLDILLYGASLSLEFVALAVLRFREPDLARPFRVPGGLFGAIAIGIPPMLLLGFSVIRSEHEQILGMSSFAFGMILIAAGVVPILINHALKPAGWAAAERKTATRSIRNRPRIPQINTD